MLPLLAAWSDYFSGEALSGSLIWLTVILFLVTGFLGTFLPVLPGTTMILAGSLLFYFTMGMESSGLAWQGLVFITLLYGLSILLDWVSGALGAKWFGSSKWGIVGAILGGIVGLFLGLPGLILGPIAGVFIFEIFVAKKEVKEAGQSTVGTVVGGIAGIIGRVLLALGMIVWFVVDVFFVN
jgi:uncharacterized protein YqgC (DUF456 family)